MWTRPALSLLQCWALPTQTPYSCQPRPFSRRSSHQASSVWSMSAPPSRTLHGKSPVWISLTRRSPSLSLLAAAGPGRNEECSNSPSNTQLYHLQDVLHTVSHIILSVFVVSSSPAGTQVSAESCRIPLSQFIKNSALRHNHSTSAPSTPELHVRRQYSQSFRYTEKSDTLVHKCTASITTCVP